MLLNICFFVLQLTFHSASFQSNFKCGLEGSCVFGFGDCTESRCAGDECNARQSNIEGELLILDYNSLFYNAGPNHPPAVTNPARCCDKCKETEGCNAWTFCSNRDGCGSGCSDYIISLAQPDAGNNVRRENGRFLPFPIPGFGQFESCQDKWPWLMCSLKKVQNIDSPVEAGAEDGWVSGVVRTDRTCDNSPNFALCNTCQRSSDSPFCNQCASEVPQSEQLLCGNCANLSTPSLQRHCVDCLIREGGSRSGCGQCAKFDAGEEQCFGCTQNVVDLETQKACVACQISVPGQFECMQVCAKAQATPLHARTECGRCYQTNNPKRCVQCLQESQEGDTWCSSCTTEECFSCLSQYPTNQDARVGCARCALLTDAGVRAECFQCVANPQVEAGTKQVCKDCAEASNNLQERSSCFECLESTATSYACPDCLRDGNDPEPCFQCVQTFAPRGSLALACASCEALDSPQKRTACFACMQDSGKQVVAGEMCHTCFAAYVNDQESCLACLNSAKTKEEVWDICW